MNTLIFLISTLLLAGCVFSNKHGDEKLFQQGTEEQGVVRFIAMGDYPYVDKEKAMMPQLPEKIAKVHPEFLIHVGDFKASRASCADKEHFQSKKELFALLPKKVIYTPGDNDWTDCDEKRSGSPISELNRLKFIEKHFLSELKGYPKTWKVKSQKGQRENLSWNLKGVLFSTYHLVGTNNGRAKVHMDKLPKAIKLAEQRIDKAMEWVDVNLKRAHKNKSRALVLALHADFYGPEHYARYSGDCTKDHQQRCDGFAEFKAHLEKSIQNSKIPILLIHGDTSDYCMDQPIDDNKMFWRLNLPGDYVHSDIADVVVTKSEELPFMARGLLTQELPAASCKK